LFVVAARPIWAATMIGFMEVPSIGRSTDPGHVKRLF